MKYKHSRQDSKVFEERHPGVLNENMLVNYCCSTIRETDSNNRKYRQKFVVLIIFYFFLPN